LRSSARSVMNVVMGLNLAGAIKPKLDTQMFLLQTRYLRTSIPELRNRGLKRAES